MTSGDKPKTGDFAKIIKVNILILTVVFLLIGAGFGFGYYYAIKDFRGKIQANSIGETLGKIIKETKERKTVSHAYIYPDQAEKELNHYTWDVRTTMSPFVGYGCEPGSHYSAQINSMQFRSGRELIVPKPADRYRIFLTGGSTAFSVGAPSQDRIIAAYLSRLLNESLSSVTRFSYEVFTMATPAWASTQERIMIENRLSELEPDLVISLSGNNDVHWGMLGRNVLWFRSLSDDFYWDLLNTTYHTAGFRTMVDVTETLKARVPPDVVAERLAKNVRLSAYILSLQKVPYVFCLQPTLAVTKKSLAPWEDQWPKVTIDYFNGCYKEMDRHLSRMDMANFTYFNLSHIFDQEGRDELIFIDSYHFGDKGNEMIAGHIYQGIRNIVMSSGRIRVRRQQQVPVCQKQFFPPDS